MFAHTHLCLPLASHVYLYLLLLTCAEKQMHMNKEKERLRQLIEQKLQAKSTLTQVSRVLYILLSIMGGEVWRGLINVWETLGLYK